MRLARSFAVWLQGRHRPADDRARQLARSLLAALQIEVFEAERRLGPLRFSDCADTAVTTLAPAAGIIDQLMLSDTAVVVEFPYAVATDILVFQGGDIPGGILGVRIDEQGQ